MKLTNKQLQILVDNIYTEHFEAAFKKEKEVYDNNKKRLKLTTQEEKVIRNYFVALTEHNKIIKRINNKLTLNDLRQDVLYYKRYDIHFKPKTPTKQQIKEAIVLATIDSKDVNDLIKAVTSKFKLK